MKTNTAEIIPPTPERGQHDEIEAAIDGRTGREEIKGLWRLKDATQIDKYWARRLLSKDRDENDALRETGNKYAALCYIGGVGPRFASNAHGIGGRGSSASAIDQQIEARQRIQGANKLIGEAHASVLWAVCIDEKTASGWAADRWRQRGWGRPSGHVGMAFLIDALKLVRDYWGK